MINMHRGIEKGKTRRRKKNTLDSMEIFSCWQI